MNFSSNSFQRNTVFEQLISIAIGHVEVYYLLTHNSFTYNVGTAIGFLYLSNVSLENTSFGHNLIPQKHFHLTTIKHFAVVYINRGIFQMKNVQFF